MDSNNASPDEGISTTDFIERVGELVSEEHEELEQLWNAACAVR
jgi:hypothetical protein